VGPSRGEEWTATGKLRFGLLKFVNRKLVGALLAVVGIILIALAIMAAQQHCPVYPQNTTAPVAACAAYDWTTLPIAMLVIGILLLPTGAAVALYPGTGH
jgi:uncharacterized membrane protein YidH (DUF202 family)